MKSKEVSYSQNGEDLILEATFVKLNQKEPGYFVDVGASDGITNSNTYLFAKGGWKGLMIDQDRRLFRYMLSRFMKTPEVKPVLFNVATNDLDALLRLYGVPKNFELLNIDIDSYDYHVWKNLKDFRPKVVIIETNSRKGKFISYRNGASPESMLELAKEKGYKPVAFTGNYIFIDENL